MVKITGRHIARTVALLWGAFWSYFVLASALGDPGTPWQKALACVLGVGLFAGSALLPWWKERLGSLLLLIEGVALCIANYTYLHNPPATQVFLLLTLALPPLAAGILFLAARSRTYSQPG